MATKTLTSSNNFSITFERMNGNNSVEVRVYDTAGTLHVTSVSAASALTAQERTDIVTLLTKLRDAGLTALGFA